MAVDANGQEEARKRREVGIWTSPEHAALLQRIRPTMGSASTEDLLDYARIELEDALDNVDPIEGGSEYHAGCCMMRARAAIEVVRDRERLVTRQSTAEIVSAARLVLLAWMGDSIDGGKTLRELLPRLREAFDDFDRPGRSLERKTKCKT